MRGTRIKITALLYRQQNNRQLTALPGIYERTDSLTVLCSYVRIKRFTSGIAEPIHIQ